MRIVPLNLSFEFGTGNKRRLRFSVIGDRTMVELVSIYAEGRVKIDIILSKPQLEILGQWIAQRLEKEETSA
jgi:hypothetical protein